MIDLICYYGVWDYVSRNSYRLNGCLWSIGYVYIDVDVEFVFLKVNKSFRMMRNVYYVGIVWRMVSVKLYLMLIFFWIILCVFINKCSRKLFMYENR